MEFLIERTKSVKHGLVVTARSEKLATTFVILSTVDNLKNLQFECRS